MGYKNCISLTKVAFGLQKLRFAYKYLVVELQSCISGYKTASRFAIEYDLLGDIEKNLHINEDPFTFAGIRDYQPFDSMHSIKWKTTARH